MGICTDLIELPHAWSAQVGSIYMPFKLYRQSIYIKNDQNTALCAQQQFWALNMVHQRSHYIDLVLSFKYGSPKKSLHRLNCLCEIYV